MNNLRSSKTNKNTIMCKYVKYKCMQVTLKKLSKSDIMIRNKNIRCKTCNKYFVQK